MSPVVQTGLTARLVARVRSSSLMSMMLLTERPLRRMRRGLEESASPEVSGQPEKGLGEIPWRNDPAGR